jgi:hypothetical protein
VPEVRQLVPVWRDRLVAQGVYSQEEMAALIGAEISWAPPDRLFGPLTTVARVDGQVIGGVELWEQQRDRFWFVDCLIRDPAPQFKGVGVDLYRAALAWWIGRLGRRGWPLKVHSMEREEAAVRWWTQQLGRPPDFADAFMRKGGYEFKAVGWTVHPG